MKPSPESIVAAWSFALAVLACDANDAVPRAGIVLGEDPVAGQPPPGQRWVLRDADGAAVNAVVEPTCRGNGPNCVVNEIGTVGGLTPQCARILWLGDQYVDLRYDLDTGRPEDCASTVPSISYIGFYVEPGCGGDIHGLVGGGTANSERWTRRARYVEDSATLLFESSLTEPIHPGSVFTADDCEPYEYDEDLVPWLPVPDWAVDALANPPYVITWE